MDMPRRDLNYLEDKYFPLPIAGCPSHDPDSHPKSHSRRRRFVRWGLFIVLLVQALLISLHSLFTRAGADTKNIFSISGLQYIRHDSQQLCVQETALQPQHALYEKLAHIFGTLDFRNHTIGLHSGAVKIPTESDNQMGDVGEDPRWEAFGPFHDYLLKSFPRVSVPFTPVN